MRLVCNALGEILSERNMELFDAFWAILLADITAAFEAILDSRNYWTSKRRIVRNVSGRNHGIIMGRIGGNICIRNYWNIMGRTEGNISIGNHGINMGRIGGNICIGNYWAKCLHQKLLGYQKPHQERYCCQNA